jgi:hypothetical protein
VVTAYNLPVDYVLYEMSYANMILYSAVLPSYDSKKGNKGGGPDSKQQEIIKVDDPRNRDKVKHFFEQID